MASSSSSISSGGAAAAGAAPVADEVSANFEDAETEAVKAQLGISRTVPLRGASPPQIRSRSSAIGSFDDFLVFQFLFKFGWLINEADTSPKPYPASFASAPIEFLTSLLVWAAFLSYLVHDHKSSATEEAIKFTTIKKYAYIVFGEAGGYVSSPNHHHAFFSGRGDKPSALAAIMAETEKVIGAACALKGEMVSSATPCIGCCSGGHGALRQRRHSANSPPPSSSRMPLNSIARRYIYIFPRYLALRRLCRGPRRCTQSASSNSPACYSRRPLLRFEMWLKITTRYSSCPPRWGTADAQERRLVRR